MKDQIERKDSTNVLCQHLITAHFSHLPKRREAATSDKTVERDVTSHNRKLFIGVNRYGFF